MKTETKLMYICEFCNKHYQRKNHCTYHELNCKKNPNNKHICFQCENLEYIQQIETEYDYLGNEHDFKFNTFMCKKHDQEMFSYKLRQNSKLRAFVGGIRMPLACNDFKFNDYDLCNNITRI